MNKYYTPSLDEFRVDFEYERLGNNKWESHIYGLNCSDLSDIYESLSNNIIRVKYLTEYDILSIGFKRIFTDKYIDCFTNGFFYIQIRTSIEDYFGVGLVIGYEDSSKEFQRCFSGFIRNISELKILLRQLKIKTAINPYEK